MPEDGTPTKTNDAEAHWVERSVGGLLSLLGGTVSVFFDLLTRPWWSPRVSDVESARTPPLSFLIVSLLFAGLAARVFVLYFAREIDRGVTDALVDAFTAWGPKEVLLLTVPIIVLIVMSGLGAARWTYRASRDPMNDSGKTMDNPIVRVVCYAAGFQITALGLLAAGFLALSFGYGAEAVQPLANSDALLLGVMGFLVLWATVQIERGLKARGNCWLAKTLFTRTPVAVATSLAVLLGFLTTGYFTFDLKSAAEQAYRAHIQREIDVEADLAIATEVVDSHSEVLPSGDVRLTQTILLTNYMPHQWAVPRPDVLRPARDRGGKPCLSSPVRVEWCSVDLSENAGWILKPRESRLVRWTLLVPKDVCLERPRAVVEMPAANADVERLLTVGAPEDEGSRRVTVIMDWADANERLAAESRPADAVPTRTASSGADDTMR